MENNPTTQHNTTRGHDKLNKMLQFDSWQTNNNNDNDDDTMPKKRKMSLGVKRKQGRRTTTMASATATAMTASLTMTKKADMKKASATTPATTNKRRKTKDPPGLTARKAAKATAPATAAATATALTDTKIIQDLLEMLQHPTGCGRLMKFLSKEAIVASDGHLKPAATAAATTEATDSPAEGSDGSEGSLDRGMTSVDKRTCPRPSVPSLARSARIQDGDPIPLDTKTFRLKKDGSLRAEEDIHGPHGSATQAKNRAASSTVKHTTGNQQLAPEQRVLVSREASKHPKAGLCFERAGLIDTQKEDTLRHVVSQSNKLIGSAWANLVRQTKGNRWWTPC